MKPDPPATESDSERFDATTTTAGVAPPRRAFLWWWSAGSRVAQTLLAMLGASVLIWAILPLAPGDPAIRTLQARGIERPREAEVEAVRRELRLDEPRAVQYFSWLGRAVRGDLSISYQTGRPVLEELGKRLPATLLLAALALTLAVTLSLIVALAGAFYHDQWPDKFLRLLTQIGASVPAFLLGLLALQFIVVAFGWGRVVSAGTLRDAWLPAFCLAAGRAADWSQVLRANLLEARGARHTLVASARGATRWRVLWRHALPNALPPFVTLVGLGVGSLLGGAAIVEMTFSWPGVGSYVVSSIIARDLPIVQGFVVISTLTYVAAHFAADALNALIDPRLRAGKTT